MSVRQRFSPRFRTHPLRCHHPTKTHLLVASLRLLLRLILSVLLLSLLLALALGLRLLVALLALALLSIRLLPAVLLPLRALLGPLLLLLAILSVRVAVGGGGGTALGRGIVRLRTVRSSVRVGSAVTCIGTSRHKCISFSS